ncbi:FKBP-type peptidyl-prolyl cis-trans isomerase [Methylophilaceae bacterium]|jgi:FKBP-type peptidyl-prolyl cis-trans isomerase FkpA|nr:FKBP-type peptidyl-prolyl cis-trans isomerase [Methylophilaceae bacterium]|tara:strand:- start:1918 stop:2361 length:444 start_codon:yes stop_codon:yes gene_type:complete
MIKKIFILIAMMSFTSLSFAIEIVNQEKDKMQEKGITELIITDNKVGDGREAEKGLTVTVHYTGWLYENGEKTTKFDSSVDRREPFSFVLGVGQVIKGWDNGVSGMQIGGSRTIVIPSDMGYGSRGAGSVIPPNSDLIFEVELIEIQ